MPIRLNLLAEAQAAEEARRRDPVKRAIWVAALLVVVILVWSSSLQLKAILIHSDVGRLEAQIGAHTNEYRLVLDNQNKTAEIKHKLKALRQLAANRLLNGTLLNALQQTTVDDVQLLRLRLEQTYVYFEGTKAPHQRRQRPHPRQAPPPRPKRPCSPSKAPTPPPTPATS